MSDALVKTPVYTHLYILILTFTNRFFSNIYLLLFILIFSFFFAVKPYKNFTVKILTVCASVVDAGRVRDCTPRSAVTVSKSSSS